MFCLNNQDSCTGFIYNYRTRPSDTFCQAWKEPVRILLLLLVFRLFPDLHHLSSAVEKTKQWNVKIWTLEQTWETLNSSFESILWLKKKTYLYTKCFHLYYPCWFYTTMWSKHNYHHFTNEWTWGWAWVTQTQVINCSWTQIQCFFSSPVSHSMLYW